MQRLDPELLKFWEEASWAYHRQMSPEGLSYLAGRGISMDSVVTFRLGQVVEPMPGHEMMTGRIAIPYIKKLATVAIKFRCIKDHVCKEAKCAKYLSDGGQWLYGTADLDAPSDFIAIAEGEFDTIVLHQIGIPAVGIPGVEAWKSHGWWPENLKGHRRVFMFADNDSGKEKNYGMELARRIQKDVPCTRLVNLPEESDVTETFLGYGPEDLFKRAGLEDYYHPQVLAA